MARIRQTGSMLMLAAGLFTATSAVAQSLFSPVITVNDRAITGFELDQRVQLLTFFNTPGDVQEQARNGLIDDRLRAQELERAGYAPTEEGLAAAIDEFAARADLTGEQFTTLIIQNGIDPETLRDFIFVSAAWRDYIRLLYSPRVNVTEADIDFALARQNVSAGVEVLLSEIIIPAPPEQAGQAQALAMEISRITTTAAFEAQAREVSAVPSRDNGGRLEWTPLSNYPAGLQQVLLSLAPGEVTPPISINGGVALLQMRDLREGTFSAASPATIDYAAFYIPGGRSAAAIAEAQALAGRIDTCDDLYTQARGLPPERLARISAALGDIPQEIALELAKLDRDEVSYNLTSTSGDALIFLMLCSRSYPLPEGADRDAVRNRLQSEQLSAYADALLADLRAAATIVGE